MKKWISAVACLIIIACSSIIAVSCHDDGPHIATTPSLDVIIIAGQSNAEYTVERCTPETIQELYPQYPEHNLYYYGTSEYPQTYWQYENNNYSLSKSDLHPMWSNNRWMIGGYEPYIANETSKIRGNDVLIVNTGVGGKMISELLPNAPFGNYGMAAINSALDSASTSYSQINMLYWIWIQGEADYNTPVEQYIDDFIMLQSKFDEYGLDNCYIVHTRDMWGGNANIAQKQLSDNDSHITIVAECTESFSLEEGGCLLDEPGAYGIHYSCKGRFVISKEIISSINLTGLDTNP